MISKLLSGLILTFLLVSCSSTKITSDYDKETDFSQYKDFHYLGWAKQSDQILNDLDKTRIEKAFTNEFAKRGVKFVDKSEADATVSLFVVVDERTSTTAYSDYYGGMGYGYGYGYPRWGWGGGMSTTRYQENHYLVGTLVVDVFDAGSKKLIWQGVASGTINENTKNREERINRLARAIMVNYPVEPAD
ncbi:MAG: hypothetical protein DHS20C17_31510 [Cyclobacteriaceae bacterium]|nr:MAG: hypothetical protein DHS20C17_31510 [Cyclobacteriaceae bacterium]